MRQQNGQGGRCLGRHGPQNASDRFSCVGLASVGCVCRLETAPPPKPPLSLHVSTFRPPRRRAEPVCARPRRLRKGDGARTAAPPRAGGGAHSPPRLLPRHARTGAPARYPSLPPLPSIFQADIASYEVLTLRSSPRAWRLHRTRKRLADQQTCRNVLLLTSAHACSPAQTRTRRAARAAAASSSSSRRAPSSATPRGGC